MSTKKLRRWCSACGSLAVGEAVSSCPSCGSSRMAMRPSLSATPSSLGKMAVIASALGLAACGANEEREPDAVEDVQTPDDAVGGDTMPDDDGLTQPLYGEPTDVETDVEDDVPVEAYGMPPEDVSDDTDQNDVPVQPPYGISPEDAGFDGAADAADGSADVDSDIDIPTPEYGIPPEP